MKKWLIGSALALAALCGVAVAQVPGLFLTTLTGNEQINVLVPSTGTVITSPQITTIKAVQLRDASGYQIVTQVAALAVQISPNVSALSLQGATAGTSGTITFAANPVDGQRILIFSQAGFSGAALAAQSGQTINVGITSLAANGSAEYIYQASTTTWFRIQ